MNYYAIILVGTAASLFVVVWAITELASGTEEQRELARRSTHWESQKNSTAAMMRFDAALRRTDLGKKLHQRIQRSGLSIRLPTFIALLAVTGVVAIFAVGSFLSPIFGVAAAVLVAYLFIQYLRHHEERRKEEFTAQLPDVARVLSNATSAGLALPTAVDMAAEELDAPAGPELRRVADSLKIGQSFDAAMTELRERMPSREIGILIGTLIISSRSGGALVSALRTISTTLEARKETRREVKTILGESTSTAWALTALAIASLFLVNIMFPGSIDKMTASLWGQALLALACGLLLTGIVAIRYVTRFDY